MKELVIGEVVRRSGVAASTLRYYEEKGLIRSIGRRGLSRVFHGDVLNISIAVTDIGRAGFTLIYLFERASDGQQIGRIKNGMVFYDYQQQCVANTPVAFSTAFTTTP